MYCPFLIDLYEETFSLVYDLTNKSISQEMWQMLELIYQVFKKNGTDYFIDIMPALHNYVTVDTNEFLSNPNRLLAMFDMCKTVSILELFVNSVVDTYVYIYNKK